MLTHPCLASVMTVWQKYLFTRIVSPVGEVEVTETALSQGRNSGILNVVLTTVKNGSISAGPISARHLSLCKFFAYAKKQIRQAK